MRVRARHGDGQPITPLYRPYISLYLPYISAVSPPHLTGVPVTVTGSAYMPPAVYMPAVLRGTCTGIAIGIG